MHSLSNTYLGCVAAIGLSIALLAGCAGVPPVTQAATAAVPAQVERLDISVRKPAFGGASFGDVGPYEFVAGVATVRLDPRDPANKRIVDLDRAVSADGWVRYRTDVALLRPVRAQQASGAWIVEIANRGNKLALARLNEGATQFDTQAQAGHGWAMRQGHTLVWVGWQGDVELGAQGRTVGTRFPVATEQGQPMVGTSVEEFIFDDAQTMGKGVLVYPAASLERERASLSVRARPSDAPQPLPATAWRYLSPTEIEIQRPSTADGGAIYQFIYPATAPKVMGLGLSAMRDVVAFLKSGQADGAGQPGPLADLPPRVTVALGISQSGRFLRDFIWQGFNAQPGGGKVFDGAMPVIAGSRKSYVNVRWAQPGRYSRQHEDHYFYGDQFPFSYAVTRDPLTGRSDGIFAGCEAQGVCPRLMHLDSSLEFWQARAALVVSDGEGRATPLPDQVRAYLMAGTQHGPATTPVTGICQQPSNTAEQASLVRGLTARLIEWSRDGVPPPASRYPALADGGLVAATRPATGFPDLAPLGVRFPEVLNELGVMDYGVVPPQENSARRYRVLVPRTDADGQDIDGVRLPDVEVPLATHTGWSLRKAGYTEGDLCSINGTQLAFAPDAAARKAARDPRLSVAERYASREAYLQQVRASAQRLADQGYLLAEDVPRWVAKGEALWQRASAAQ